MELPGQSRNRTLSLDAESSDEATSFVSTTAGARMNYALDQTLPELSTRSSSRISNVDAMERPWSHSYSWSSFQLIPKAVQDYGGGDDNPYRSFFCF